MEKRTNVYFWRRWNFDQPLKICVFSCLLAFSGVNTLLANSIESRQTSIDKNEIARESGFQDSKQQLFTVNGIISDISKEPLIGVSIQVKGTTRGSVSDQNGKFSIQADPNATLVFSYLGYLSKEITVDSKNMIDVTLLEDPKMLEEVVIVGFGGLKKANLTGAVSSIKMDEVLGSRPITNTAQALSGAIPGLLVTPKSGEPGIIADLNIRGAGRIVPSTDVAGAWKTENPAPLILVDNVPIENLAMINPNDIESVTVLKDAAASAIHGARAAFGVVLITTKKGGKEQKARINYSNSFAFSSPLELSKKASILQNVQGWIDAGITGSPIGGGQETATWKSALQDYAVNPSNYPDGYAVIKGVRYDLEEHDPYEEFLDNAGFQQIHNLSVSGGSQKSAYRMSFGYTDEDGVIVTNKDSYSRYNASITASSDITNWLNAQGEAIYSKSNKKMPNGNSNGGYWVKAAGQLPTSPVGFSDYITPGELLPIATPANLVKFGDLLNTNRDELRLVGRLTLTPFKDLKVVGEYTFYTNRINESNYDKRVKMVDADKWNTVYTSEKGYSVFRKKNALTNHNALNVYATYGKKIGSHNFTLMGGFNQEEDYYEELTAQNTDMINGELPSIAQGTGTISANDSYREYSIRGLFYRLNYDYQGKYLLEFNGRYDGSSKFPKESRFGFFPSFSAGWRVSEEAFMEGLKPNLSNLKLRASWGNIGNQSIPPYSYIPEMSSGFAQWAGGSGVRYRTLGPAALVSNDFTWERVQTLDFGVDISFLDNRLSSIFDWYSRQTLGLLAPGMDLPAVIGASAPRENSADLKTNGWELEVNWRDKIGNVSYHVGFNIFDAQSEVTKFGDNETKLIKDNNLFVGKKVGEIWGLTTDRYYTEGDFEDYTTGKLKPGIPALKGQSRQFAGDILYTDFDEDGQINADIKSGQTLDKAGDYKVIGNTTPRYNYGFNGGLNWNNFDFSFFLQGVGKRDFWMDGQSVTPYGLSGFNSLYESVVDYWTPENTDAKYPRFYNNSGSFTDHNYKVQSKYLQNGAFLRLKNLTFGYKVPSNILKKANIETLRLFVSGENLYTFKQTPSGIEPDLDSQAGLLQYPYMRMFSFGLNLSF